MLRSLRLSPRFAGGFSRPKRQALTREKVIASVVRGRDLPGYELFQYRDDFGELHALDSSDVNSCLHKASGADFTAKDLRTRAGTLQASRALAQIGSFMRQREAKRNILEAVKRTAEQLGNRPATCRKYHIHQAIVDAYPDGTLLPAMARRLPQGKRAPVPG